MSSTPLPTVVTCPQCASDIAPTMLACPSCGRLVYSDQLTELSASAREAAESGDNTAALSFWRQALELLPVRSKQHAVISAKVAALSESLIAGTEPAKATGAKRTLVQLATGAGALGLMIWKFKALFAGLTKGSTFFSMLLSLGVYWTAWGWQFALGLVLSIYVHEMGHVLALRRLGFAATAPMFIPGLGALIRLKQRTVSPREDAEIGLAGPIYGLGAAVVVAGLWFATERPILAAIAGVGAWINLFNLLPLGPLDGGRAFHAMSRPQKYLATATIAASWYFTEDGLLILVGLFSLGRAAADPPAVDGSRRATIIYCLLVIALSALSLIRLKSGIE